MDSAAPSPASTASSAGSSGIFRTGIFVVVSPSSTGPCSAALGTRRPRGFLAGGWRAVTPLGTACLSVCLFCLCFKRAQLCLGCSLCLSPPGIPIPRLIPSLRSSRPGFPDFAFILVNRTIFAMGPSQRAPRITLLLNGSCFFCLLKRKCIQNCECSLLVCSAIPGRSVTDAFHSFPPLPFFPLNLDE